MLGAESKTFKTGNQVGGFCCQAPPEPRLTLLEIRT